MKKLAASDIVESKCTRCKRVTNHTIVAMVEGRVVRVQCNTCGGTHNYRPLQAEPVARQPRAAGATAKSTTAKKSMAIEETWEKMLSDKDPAKALPYNPAGKFKMNELVNHPVFGMGAVAVVRGNKMEVVFRDGMKVLRCA